MASEEPIDEEEAATPTTKSIVIKKKSGQAELVKGKQSSGSRLTRREIYSVLGDRRLFAWWRREKSLDIE
jgi:hypothetical protein